MARDPLDPDQPTRGLDTELARRLRTFDAASLLTAADHIAKLDKRGALASVVDFLAKHDVGEMVNKGLQVQKVLDNGLAGGASALVELVEEHDPSGKMAQAVRARAWKELALKASDVGGTIAQEAMTRAFNEYKSVYDMDPERRVRAGLNLIGLSTLAAGMRLSLPEDIDRARVASGLLEDLNKTPQVQRGPEFHASRAEAFVALRDIDRAQAEIATIVQTPALNVEMLGAFTNQLKNLWKLAELSEQGSGIIKTLTAARVAQDFTTAKLPADVIKELATTPSPPTSQLEAILGPDGPQTYDWFKLGMETSQSVGVVRISGVNKRVGTGFIVRGGDIIPSLGDELCVMTNSHVVSDVAEDEGISADEAEIVFDAIDKAKPYRFSQIERSWRRTHLDTTVLRFQGAVPPASPLGFAKNLPLRDGKQRVYVIGYPNGGDLSISLHNNILLDHEGPSEGTPPDKSVCRVQYSTPTEHGNSGSPVCNGHNWKVIALHHAGDEHAMRRLNGRDDTWPANEGIWIQSICTAGRGETPE